MNIKQTQEYLNQLASEIPIFNNDKILKKNKYRPRLNSNSDRNRKFINMLYVHKGVPFIIEVSYIYNNDYTKYIVLEQNIISAYYNKRLYSNAYFVMSWGFKSKDELDFKYKRPARNNWQLEEYKNVIKGSNFMRSLEYISQFEEPIHETMYKLGLKNLIGKAFASKSNKPRVALGLELLDKTQFNKFVEWVKNKRNFQLTLYRDFLEMAKNKKHKNVFIGNWLELHDKWSGITKQRENEKIAKEDLKIWNSLKYDKSDIEIKSMKDKEQMGQLGKDLNNCLRNMNHDYKQIYEIINHETQTSLALQWKNNQVHQLYGYGNNSVNEDVKRLITNIMRKEVEHETI